MSSMLTVKQHVYELIRQKLETGILAPGGRLSDDALSKELGVSRSPVREAIGQLTSEGLVEYRPRRGCFVRQPRLKEMRELYEVRMALEGFAAAKAAERSDEAEVACMEQAVEDLRKSVEKCRGRAGHIADAPLTKSFLAADSDFHQSVWRAAGNETIQKMIGDFDLLTKFLGHLPIQHDLRIMSATYRQHASIAKAIRSHNPTAARDHMAEHITASWLVVRPGYPE
jgi:DNA-binding GntR family transcriptional regulator